MKLIYIPNMDRQKIKTISSSITFDTITQTGMEFVAQK